MALVTHDQLMFGSGHFRFGKRSRTDLQAPANPRGSSAAGAVELRFRVRELRTEKRGEETYLTGYAARYNVLSEDLGGWRERIQPGFFSRALRESQDVRHLQNHDPNLVLGRTKAGTTRLWEDEGGLRFETRLGGRSYERDLAESVARGDVNENSFGFIVAKGGERWVKENGVEVRELIDGDIVDISTVTYPAYPETSAGVNSRALFPGGAPAEIRSRIHRPGDCERTPAGEQRARQLAPRAGERAVEFRSVQAGDVLEMTMYDDIGEDWWTGQGITAKSVKAKLDAASGYSTIRLRINSLGGSAMEAIGIYNILRAQSKPVECFIDGIAGSAASVIAMAGDKITMGTGALMMVHCSATICLGNAAEMRDMADYLDTWDGSAAEIYTARTKQSAESMRAMMEAETWMNGKDCLEKGFCTAMAEGDETDEDEKIAEAAERSSKLLATYRNAPARLKDVVERRQERRTAEQRMRLRLVEVS